LQWVAAAIFQAGEVVVPYSHETENYLDHVLSHAFLTKIDDKVVFLNPDIRYDYLVRYAVNLLLQSWDEFDGFCSIFYQIYQFSFQIDHAREICSSVLIILNQEYEKDVIGRIFEVVIQETKDKRNSLFWNIFYPFCEALPNLRFESKSLADVLEKVIQAIARDHAGGQLYHAVEKLDHAVEKLAARSHVDADVLYNEFLARSDSPVVSLTLNVLLGLAKFSLQEAHRRALALANSDNLIYRRIGISALGYFKYSDNDIQHNLLKSTIEQLEAFRKITNPEIDYILAQAYGNLVRQSEDAAKAFIELALRNDLAVKNQVSHILFLKAEEAFTQSWYREALLNLIQPPLPSLGMIEKLDSCINLYAKNEPDTALDIIETVAINWDYSSAEQENELSSILNTTFLEIYNNHLVQCGLSLGRVI